MSYHTALKYWTLKQVHKRLEDASGMREGRRLIIAVIPNAYRRCAVYYLSLEGSPPRAHALYWPGACELHVMAGSLARKTRVPNIRVPELDDMEYQVGFYVWDPEDPGLYEWRAA